ncbi:MAG: hypothetical protein ACI8RD_012132, partial [Bacillariaceae sp.]
MQLLIRPHVLLDNTRPTQRDRINMSDDNNKKKKDESSSFKLFKSAFF